MAESNDTVPGGIIGSYTPAGDVVTGWTTKVDESSALALDGLVPFVQLIGIYSEEQIRRITGGDAQDSDITVEYVNDPEYTDWTAVATENTATQTEYFEEKIRDKYIGLNIQDYNKGSSDTYVPGIVLATTISQVGEDAFEYGHDSGGVGITELQIETGTKDFANRRYKLRMTVTDPQVLNDRPEYFKLSSLQSTFLIIHGWANPGDIPGWSGDPPPSILADGQGVWKNGIMSVDLTLPNTGGAWSAAIVATTMFDFAFNEVGQLEANFTFMPREISFLSTYRVPVVSTIVSNFLGTGEMNQPVNADTLNQPAPRFAGLVAGFGAAAGEFGKNMADIIAEEQASYFAGTSVDSRYKDISSSTTFSVSDSLRNFSDRISEWAEDSGTQDSLTTLGEGGAGLLVEQQKIAEGQSRFPHAGPGVRVYTEQEREIQDSTGAKVNIIQHSSNIVYYSLGWVLESIRLSMFDLNKNRILNGEKPFDVKFKYFPVPENSFFNLAYQNTVKSGTMPTLDGYVSEAITNLKDRGFPQLRLWNPRYQELNTHNIEESLDNEQVTRKLMKDGLPKYDRNNLRGNIPSGSDLGNYKAEALNAGITKNNYSVQAISANGIRKNPVFQTSSSVRSYLIMKPSTFGGPFDELKDLGDDKDLLTYEFRRIWESLGTDERHMAVSPKLGYIRDSYLPPDPEAMPFRGWPTADYRKSLVETGPDDPAGPGMVRIMHPEFEGQLLYSYAWNGAIRIATNDPNAGQPEDRHKGNAALWLFNEWDGFPTAASTDNFEDHLGGFLRSQVKNFFVGELLQTKKKEVHDDIAYVQMDYREPPSESPGLGIIMPAIAARYFHPTAYLYNQRKWYNLHVAFLEKHFNSIVRDRLTLALQTGLSLSDIRYEPVDLEWLTGRKYDLDVPLWPGAGSGATFAKYNNSAEGTASLRYANMWINYPPGETAHTTPYASDHRNALLLLTNPAVQKIEIAENVADIQILEENLNNKITEKEGLENVVNGTGTPNDQNYFMAVESIRHIPPISETSYENIEKLEDHFIDLAGEGLGLPAQASWWRERLGVLLVELYNLDLIDLGPNTALTKSDTGEKTKAATAYNEHGRDPGSAAERFIITNVAVDDTLYFENLLERPAGYRGFYIATADHVNLQPMVEIGQELSASTYLAPNFTLEQVKMFGTPSLNPMGEDWFDYVIRIQFDPNSRLSVVNSESAGRIGNLDFSENGSGANYLFENYIDKNSLQPLNISGNKFLDIYTGEQLAAEMSGRDIGLDRLVKEGTANLFFTLDAYQNQEATNYAIIYNAWKQYTEYMAKVHRLMARYLTKIEYLDNLTEEKSTDIDTATTEINRLSELITTNQDILAILEGGQIKAFSPFLRVNDFDMVNKRDMGGGRTMDVYGLAAQQWALRFSKKITFGSTDIAWYRPKKGGIIVSPKVTGNYKWTETDNWTSQDQIRSYSGSWRRKDFDNSHVAKLNNWNGEPKSILDMEKVTQKNMVEYEWGPPPWRFAEGVRQGRFIYTVYGVLDEPSSWKNDQPNCLFSLPIVGGSASLNAPNRLYASHAEMDKQPKLIHENEDGLEYWSVDDQGAGFPPNLDIIHLVRTGLVNEGLIKEQIQNNWRMAGIDPPQSIGFEDDDGVSIRIIGKWPLYIVPLWRAGEAYAYNFEAVSPGVLTNYIGPAYLVDEDLDFVTQAKDVFPYEYFHNDGHIIRDEDMISSELTKTVTVDTWVKMDMRFEAESLQNRRAYDGVNGLGLYKGNHIPNVTIETARRIAAETSHPGPKTGYQAFNANGFNGYWGDDTKHLGNVGDDGWGVMDGMEPRYGEQFFFQGMKYRGTTFSGRVPFSAKEYPLGIPISQREGYPGEWDRNKFTPTDRERTGGINPGSGYPSFRSPTEALGTNGGEVGVQLVGQSTRFDGVQRNYSQNTPDRGENARDYFERLGLPNDGPGLYPGASDFWEYDEGGMCVNDVLNVLPPAFERGFFSSVKYANESFEQGAPMHPGMIKWISEDLMNLFINGRRIAIHGKYPKLNNMKEDVCYGDLFPANTVTTSRADFSNQTIQSVAELPIKRKVVENLLSQKNHNMSLLQLLQQLLAPDSIALPGNIQLGIRYNKGIIDIIPASIEYKNITEDMFEKSYEANITGTSPSDQLLFNYKSRNSLIENIDMSSKMDPAAFLTYQNSSELLRGRDYNVLKLLSYEGVAEDFKAFLDNTAKPDNTGETYSGIITVSESNNVTVDKVRFEEIPSSVVDGFIAQNPGRWATITAMLQSQNNFTTELLAFYMRAVTLTIHGTTNIIPFNLINVEGVLPDLEGVYIVTNVTEKIVPTGFQTILEGKLLKKKSSSQV